MTTGNSRVTLPGTVLIACSSGPEGRRMSITVTDERSGSRVVRCELSMEQFAMALSQTNGRAELHVSRSGNIGKYPEHKDVPVPFARGWPMRDDVLKEAVTKALEPFEVDGWKAVRDAMTNSHYACDAAGVRGRGGDYQLVHFVRYLDEPPAGWEEPTHD